MSWREGIEAIWTKKDPSAVRCGHSDEADLRDIGCRGGHAERRRSGQHRDHSSSSSSSSASESTESTSSSRRRSGGGRDGGQHHDHPLSTTAARLDGMSFLFSDERKCVLMTPKIERFL